MLVIIPARGGSKGVPGKNIKELNGKPLIQYTIDLARKLSELYYRQYRYRKIKDCRKIRD